MYAYDKKVPVRNIAKKSSVRRDKQVKEVNGSRYYFEDAKGNAKSPVSNVIQRVLFADIPLDDQGKFKYKDIKEMQVWWFMACEWKKQSDLKKKFTPEKHLKSLRSLLVPERLEPFDVESGDRVRLASHGSSDGCICIGNTPHAAHAEDGSGIIDKIMAQINEGHDKQVDADYCFMAKSGLPITRGSFTMGESDVNFYQGSTVSAVGETWILREEEDREEEDREEEEGRDPISEGMGEYTTAMTCGTGFKEVSQITQDDFPLLYNYIHSEDALTEEQLAGILAQVYDNGKTAMQAFTTELERVCNDNGIPIQKIPGIWGDQK